MYVQNGAHLELVTGYKSLHLSASTTNRQGFRLQELSNPDAGASLVFRLLKNPATECVSDQPSVLHQSNWGKAPVHARWRASKTALLVRRVVSVADREIDENQIIHFSTRCLLWTALCGLCTALYSIDQHFASKVC